MTIILCKKWFSSRQKSISLKWTYRLSVDVYRVAILSDWKGTIGPSMKTMGQFHIMLLLE